MSLESELKDVPRLLISEGLLTVGISITGVLPLVVLNLTPVSAPDGFISFLRIPILLTGVLWLTFLLHLIVDSVRFGLNHETYDFDDSTTVINAVFRLLATVGAFSAPVVPLILFDFGGPPPQAGFVVVLVPALVVPILASGVVVLVHIGWLMSTGRDVTDATW
ncbi:MAG: hypothetical protein SV760_00200 [Halobacteria archaeon]|nr:hypothetical protein [Halobacteria archaeon]